jgi:hypothetical protein
VTAAELKCHGTTGVGGRAAGAAQPARYRAGTGERAEVIRDTSRREAPRMSSDLIRRSKDTEGSAASTFAMRDWLDGRRCARSAGVRFRRCRRSRRPVASLPLRSMCAASSALSRRDSRAVPGPSSPWPPGVVASLHARRGRVQRGPRGVGGLRPLVERPGSSPWRLHRAKERRARDPVRASAQLPEPEP